MDLYDFAAGAGWGKDVTGAIKPYWQELCRNTDTTLPFFANRDFCTYALTMAGINDPEIFARLAQVTDIIGSHKDIARFAAMMHYGFFLSPNKPPMGICTPPERVFGENTGIFQLLTALSALPLIEKKYSDLSIPQEYAGGAAQWIRGTIPIYAAGHNGIPGHSLCQTFWLRLHAEGKLFRIGRLEFLVEPVQQWLPEIYINNFTGEIAVLARDQWQFDANGYKCREKSVFTARFRQSGSKVCGTPVNNCGHAECNRRIELDTALWQPLFEPQDTVPSVHIPGGSGFTPDAVRESLSMAFEFFRKYFKLEIKAFACSSWLLNNAWQEELPGSNIAGFQKTGVMCGQEISPDAGLFFVYGRADADPAQLAATTALHRAFRNIAAKGEELRNGTAIFLPQR